MSHDIKSAERPAPDHVLTAIADYALSYVIESPLAYETAGYCLMDTLACGFQALKYPACTKLMGPVVPGATLTGGARVPGTSYELDPINAAFNIGAMIRWLDFNDTWLAAEWGHPSDNLGGILAVADYLSRSGKPVTVREMCIRDRNYYVRIRTVFEDDIDALTVAGGKRRWVPLGKAAGMALTGLARKVLARAHLLPTTPLDELAPENDSEGLPSAPSQRRK